MLEHQIFETAQIIRQDLAKLFQQTIEASMSALKIKMDQEIDQEIRERIAVLMFDEMVNAMPVVPYLAVWEDGAKDISHAYMSPKIEMLSGYTPHELSDIGYVTIVRGDILSYYRESTQIEEQVSGISEAQQKRVAGFLENRNWEGCYKVRKKDGRAAWVIDRSTITRFRNSIDNNLICLSNGILLESTELLERRGVGNEQEPSA
jgi:PAS domain-containing protein